MLSFNNDPVVKAKYVNRLKAHREAEHLTQGVGYDVGPGWVKGCAVGCTLECYEHARYPVELGLPEWVGRLHDYFFEALPKTQAKVFAVDLLNAIPVGVDVESVRWKLASLRHKRQLDVLRDNLEPYAEQCRAAIQQVIDLCESTLNGDFDESAAWSAADSAAWSAARSAAYVRWEADTLIQLFKDCA